MHRSPTLLFYLLFLISTILLFPDKFLFSITIKKIPDNTIKVPSGTRFSRGATLLE